MFAQGKNIEEVHDTIVNGIRSFVASTGATKCVIGLSGGIDSAVVASLAVEAIGKESLHALLMPSEFSTLHSIQDAVDLAENIGISYNIITITAIYNRFIKELLPAFGENTQWSVAEENLQARIRGTLLMAYSNKFNALLLNTSNKSELSVGYGTLYGDLAGALMVIADLYKNEVYELAHYINRDKVIIPQSTMTKAPSAELREGQKDTDTLPDYELLDHLLYSLQEGNMEPEQLLKQGVDPEILQTVISLKKRAAFKLHQLPPIIQVSEKPIVGRDKWVNACL